MTQEMPQTNPANSRAIAVITLMIPLIFNCHFKVLLLSPLAVLAEVETSTDIARFGDKKLPLLRRFRPFRDGTPPPDRAGDIFAKDAGQFQRRFVAWVVQ